ncbi:hypothetical protein OG754_14690 [Streptomyces decoyicus]|uniref:hypothetical protein n=1 Tax=Streptomyces decoyicus TaxID=249567 RepID=UPI002E37C4D6|nr:hypothetical protein [Streptomyces decoyicus]
MAGNRIEDLLDAVTLSGAQLRRAVGRFEGGTADMLRSSVATAERAFAELDVCDEVIDAAGAHGEKAAERLRGMLEREAREEIAAELDALDEAAEGVWQALATSRLLNRVLGRGAGAGEEDNSGVEAPRLVEAVLPAVPSADHDEDDYDDLLAMAADREAEFLPKLETAHRERASQVAAHLVTVVRGAAKTGFADERFARGSLAEARAAHVLWLRCLAERRRDLGR